MREALEAKGGRVVGLHAHTGSGVTDAEVWREQLERFLDLLPQFPDVRIVDLGGGLGVPDRRGKPGFDLERLDALLTEAAAGHDIAIWLEPGRYLAAECGVLLARVTQLKSKGQHHYLGVGTGMNSLIRPALYGAWHEVLPLAEPATDAHLEPMDVVGPICETGDFLGKQRALTLRQGSLLAVRSSGAYGFAMSSNYNSRPRVPEVLVDGDRDYLVRERETIESLYAGEHLLPEA